MRWCVESAAKQYGVERVELITGTCGESVQFRRGLGGVGAILRYAVAHELLTDAESEEDEPELEDSPDSDADTATESAAAESDGDDAKAA